MLKKLYLHNLRCISNLELNPRKGINIIVGNNGSGKTTLLEGIYILFKGKSFRHQEVAPLIKDQKEELLLTAVFEDAAFKKKHQIGIRKSRSETEVRLNGQKTPKRSEIMKLLPIQWIGPEPQNLITGGPSIRRKFIDNGLFHVEQDYLETLQTYNRALNQRNAALKQLKQNIALWDDQLNLTSIKLDKYRSNYINLLAIEVKKYLQEWGVKIDLQLSYERGWPQKEDLAHCLQQTLNFDIKRHFTCYGPHRADLIFKSTNYKSGKKLSRGQLKMVATAFHFSQSDLAKRSMNYRELLLFDDISAELDLNNREILIDHIQQNYHQSFLSALSENELRDTKQKKTLFHVEHGKLR